VLLLALYCRRVADIVLKAPPGSVLALGARDGFEFFPLALQQLEEHGLHFSQSRLLLALPSRTSRAPEDDEIPVLNSADG